MTSIEIPENISIYVQKADIEQASRRNVIAYVLSLNIDISNERFQQYQKDYEEKMFIFETIKTELEKEYIIPKIKSKNYNWKLDYNKNIITVIEEE